jgi:hypothetical protein
VVVAANYEAATHSRSACRWESMPCFMPAANNLLIARLTNLSNFKLIKEIVKKADKQDAYILDPKKLNNPQQSDRSC